MSAYLVPRHHIDRLVATITRRDGLHGWHVGREFTFCRDKTPDEIGRILWLENVESLKARYPNDGSGQRPGCGETDEEVAAYTYRESHALTPPEAVKAAHCLDYQSCEHDGWAESEACAILQAFVWDIASEQPGYEDASGWNATEAYITGIRLSTLVGGSA